MKEKEKAVKKFMDEDFLLKTETAKSLYHRYAESQPIIDYHCHLSPRDIAEDRNFKNLFQAWLEGDHYKWRAMRTCGISEYFITGKATDWEKFTAWAETVPQTLRNPLYHWTHLELRRYFGITTLLNPDTAEEIYTEASRLLQSPEFSVKNLLRKRNVKIVCTTDDPVDDLRFHKQIKQEVTDFQVLPTFRPDQSMKIADPAAFKKYVAKLSEVTGLKIESYSLLIEALKLRHNYFHENGCRISDHGVESLYSVKADAQELDGIIMRTLDGESPRAGDAEKWQMAILEECGRMNAAKGWVWQLHYGAIRNNNQRLFRTLGPDVGADSVADESVAKGLSQLLGRLDNEDQLPKTILYNLNPRDNTLVATMTGNFQQGPEPGKIQFGPAWWFLDQKQGIIDQLNTLSAQGLLSHFIGMLTDSRSFLSFPRHEYFRRILCDLLGTDIENGEIPHDEDLLKKMIEGICYKNADRYLGLT